jgi:hypothetical protein
VELDPARMSSTAVYKLLIGCVVPRPIAWVSSIDAAGVHNLAPFSYFMAITDNPPTIAFACSPRTAGDGARTRKDTVRNIEATGAFVVNVVNYVRLPNYQNYWIEAGYEDEMQAARAALARRDEAGVLAAMSDRWLADVTLFGSAAQVRDGVEAWRGAGVNTVILVPSSTRGGQMVAFEELLTAFRA